MNWLVKVISTKLQNGYRLIKHLGMGKDDVQETHYAQPYGTDANPPKAMIALFAQTGSRGESVVVGYINKHQLAAAGEHRIFSTNEDGDEVKFYIHLKADGTCEVGGDAHNAVRYSPLNDALQDFKTAMQAELTAIATGIAAGGGSYSPGTLQIDISAAKIDEIKTT